MANMPSAFQTDDIPKGEFDVMPKDDYLAEIIESEIKHTKKALKAKEDGDSDWENVGQQAVLKVKLVGGQYDGRLLWARLNIINRSSPKAVEIGQQEWKAIRDACGVGIVNDTSKVHGIRVVIKVDIEEETKDQPARNKITGWKSANGFVAKPVSKAGAAKPTQPAKPETKTANPPASGVKKSWQKGAEEEQPTSDDADGGDSED